MRCSSTQNGIPKHSQGTFVVQEIPGIGPPRHMPMPDVPELPTMKLVELSVAHLRTIKVGGEPETRSTVATRGGEPLLMAALWNKRPAPKSEMGVREPREAEMNNLLNPSESIPANPTVPKSLIESLPSIDCKLPAPVTAMSSSLHKLSRGGNSKESPERIASMSGRRLWAVRIMWGSSAGEDEHGKHVGQQTPLNPSQAAAEASGCSESLPARRGW